MTVVVCDFGLARVMKGQIFREQRGKFVEKRHIIFITPYNLHNTKCIPR